MYDSEQQRGYHHRNNWALITVEQLPKRVQGGGEKPLQTVCSRFSVLSVAAAPGCCSMSDTIRWNSFYAQLHFTPSFIELGTAKLTRTQLRAVQRLADSD
jgi:hypothetical protein